MATKIFNVLFEKRSKLSGRDWYRFFISCLILEIFSLKELNCRPSWIIEGMHVTPQAESRKVFILTANDQYEPKTRVWLLPQSLN